MKKRGPPKIDDLVTQAIEAASTETARKWTETGHVVLDAIAEKVRQNDAIPQTWLAFARTFSEWHADFLTVTQATTKPSPPKQALPKTTE